MNSPMLDVAIGLVLVFALTSLVVTTVHEIWASMFETRGKNLNLAIQSLVGDDTEFAKALVQHPLLVSMSFKQAGDERNPSYISPDVFVSALIAYLSEAYNSGARPETPEALMQALKGGMLTDAKKKAASGELINSLGSLVSGVKGDWPTFEQRVSAWYSEVGERSIGWFKRDTQLRLFVIGGLTAFALNINPLIIAPRLWSDEPLRKAMVSAAEKVSEAYAAQTSGTPTAADKSGTTARPAPAPRAATETPLQIEVDLGLDRLKEQILAAAEAPRRNRDLETAGRMEKAVTHVFDLLRFVTARREAAREDDAPQRMKDATASIDRRITLLNEALAARPTGTDAWAEIRNQLASVVADIEKEGDRLAGKTPRQKACRHIEDETARQLCDQLRSLDALSGAGLPIGWTWVNWPGCEDGECRARWGGTDPPEGTTPKANAAQGVPPPSGTYVDPGAVWRCVTDSTCRWGFPVALIGYLIIALSAMLGAPFWFDLLGKLVKLRGTGGRPEDDGAKSGTKTGNEGSAPGGTLTPPEPPANGGGSANAPPPSGSPGSRDVLTVAEAALDQASIRRIQLALGLQGEALTGFFDTNTRAAIRLWQQSQKEPQTGELTGTQIERLLSIRLPAAAPAAAPPAAPPAVPSSLIAPDSIDVRRRIDRTTLPLSEQQVRDCFGDIRTQPRPGSAGAVDIVVHGKAGQVQLELVPLVHPVLTRINANTLRVHKLALPHFIAVFDEIDRLGLSGDVLSCAGTYVPRHISSDVNRPLSRHTWGIAIDLNAEQNGLNAIPAPPGQRGTLLRVAPIFIAHGFAWGGQFTKPKDGMHFELALLAL